MSDQTSRATAGRDLLRDVENVETRIRAERLRALGFDLEELEAEAQRRAAADRSEARRGGEGIGGPDRIC